LKPIVLSSNNLSLIVIVDYFKALLQAIDRINKGFECNKDTNQVKPSIVSNRDIIIGLTKEKIAHLTKPLTNNSQYETTWKGVQFLSRILSNYIPETDNFKIMIKSIEELIRMDHNIYRLRIAWINKNTEVSTTIPLMRFDQPISEETITKQIKIRYYEIDSRTQKPNKTEKFLVLDTPWIPKSFISPLITKQIISSTSDSPSEWSNVYFNCDLKLWFISYTALILSNNENIVDNNNNNKSVRGLISADIDVSRADINQCDVTEDYEPQSDGSVVLTLSGTHKCHIETSQVSLLD
jgi:hypothetical protein